LFLLVRHAREANLPRSSKGDRVRARHGATR
jgi:hypothetical protein